MPPRPPLTSLVIHTWKEHGKPKPFSNQTKSTNAAKARISRSISHDAHLAQRLGERRHNKHSLATARSVSYEEGLETANSLLTRDERSNQQQRGTTVAPSTEDHQTKTLIDFSPVRISCLPTIPELECLSPPATSGINVSKLVASQSQSQKKKRKLKSYLPLHLNDRSPSQYGTHVSLLERSCSFDTDLSTVARKKLDMSSGIAPNL